ncbi:ArsR family transcriptional regulator [Deinococcus koreensis]|uniref:ArsR family transcriptional regulator n=1 Tax=Deinococcus koreensis TaxID=2054903 RepID=A0A2K3UXS6_9DEIO|nr:ArsR family transcriptional regulator [Deinococcus koreensis]PNY81342.1 ArsR family transcriptional regulator [Deinococcus koreensis]
MEAAGVEPPARVADARQAALLLDVGLRPLLGLLMKAPRSVSELAAELGVNPNRAQYLVGRLHTAGVARVGSVQPRAGRAVRRYAVHGRWFIPFEVTGAETLEAFLAAQLVPRIEQMVNLTVQVMRGHSDGWGYWLQASEAGGSLRAGNADDTAADLFDGSTPLLANINTLTLAPAQAQQFKARLLELFQEFEAKETPGADPYSLAILLVRGEVR